MRLAFTNHANQRVAERFANEGWRKIPHKKIMNKASLLNVGETGFVRQGRVRYVIKRTEDAALILTVYRI